MSLTAERPTDLDEGPWGRTAAAERAGALRGFADALDKIGITDSQGER